MGYATEKRPCEGLVRWVDWRTGGAKLVRVRLGARDSGLGESARFVHEMYKAVQQRPETLTVCSTTPPSALRLCGTAPRLPVYQPPNYYSYSRLKFLGPAPDCHNPTTKRSGTSHSIHQLPCNVQIKSQASRTTGTVITTEGIQ